MCRFCGSDLFPQNKSGVCYRKKCRNLLNKEWQAANVEHRKEYRKRYRIENPEKVRRQERNTQLKHDFGITLVEYEQMLADQDYKCAICKRPAGYEGKDLAVDHDHETGSVRGLLCGKCNPMIGFSGDSIATLAAAIAYLSERGYADANN